MATDVLPLGHTHPNIHLLPLAADLWCQSHLAPVPLGRGDLNPRHQHTVIHHGLHSMPAVCQGLGPDRRPGLLLASRQQRQSRIVQRHDGCHHGLASRYVTHRHVMEHANFKAEKSWDLCIDGPGLLQWCLRHSAYRHIHESFQGWGAGRL